MPDLAVTFVNAWCVDREASLRISACEPGRCCKLAGAVKKSRHQPGNPLS